jgi:hypothetical protein
METVYPGHRYHLKHLDGDGGSILQFVQRKPFHEPKEGVTNQEVLRALIDRVKVLDSETPWAGNQQIIQHLRMAIVLHEARALIRHVEKHNLPIESFPTGEDGHLIFTTFDTNTVGDRRCC